MRNIMLLFVAFLLWSSVTFSLTLDQALDEAAKYFTKTAVQIDSSKTMVIDVVNYHSNQKDRDALKIETNLYFALERYFPKFQLLLLSDSVAGVSERDSIYMKGTYEQEGSKTVLRLQALKGNLSGIILGQTMVGYVSGPKSQQSMVAVLDIESSDVDIKRLKVYSEMLRVALGDTNLLEIASSGEIDKLNPDAIQKSTGCTRDECATIIGEQLGVDRTISSSLTMIDKNKFVISAKIINIETGAIEKSALVEHNASLKTINESIQRLSITLTADLKKRLSPKSSNQANAQSAVNDFSNNERPPQSGTRQRSVAKQSETSIAIIYWMGGSISLGDLGVETDKDAGLMFKYTWDNVSPDGSSFGFFFQYAPSVTLSLVEGSGTMMEYGATFKTTLQSESDMVMKAGLNIGYRTITASGIDDIEGLGLNASLRMIPQNKDSKLYFDVGFLTQPTGGNDLTEVTFGPIIYLGAGLYL